MNDSFIDLQTVGSQSGRAFIIPAYQRGYRWTTQEVSFLITDVAEFEAADPEAFYCLQPIVVRPHREDGEGTGKWELIDGQQRLTTIWLILHALGRADDAFTLEFTTAARRDGSAQLLTAIAAGEMGGADSDSIEAHYIRQAFTWVKQWGNTKSEQEKKDFLDNLLLKTKVIWYETSAGDGAQQVFTRLNSGRIPLTDADLIKALLLQRGAGGSDAAHLSYQLEIATDWDWIERELGRPELWGFLRQPAEAAGPRIELIFRTLVATTSDDRYDLFHQVRGEVKSNARAYWQRVKSRFLLLHAWFDDPDLYHQVGFLLAVGTKLDALIAAAGGTKPAFKKYLREEMQGVVGLPGVAWKQLRYDEHPGQLGRLLLLFNVEAAWRAGAVGTRFPFHLYHRQQWSLEHIHPQHAEALSQAQRPLWLRENGQFLDKHVRALLAKEQKTESRERLTSEINSLRAEMQALETSQQIPDETFYGIQNRFNQLFSDAGEQELHGIANLALLTSADNSALSNKAFPQKREELIIREGKGSFVPIATRHVFLKYYSPDADSLLFWSAADRSGYLGALTTALTTSRLFN